MMGMVIPYEIIVLDDLKVWNEMNEHKAKNVNSFSYTKHNENGLLATFSIAEFMIFDQKIIAGITKVEGGPLGIIGLLAAIAVLAGFNEIYVLFGGGLLGILIYLMRNRTQTANGIFPFVFLQISNPSINLFDFKLLLTFFKIGSILYGSDYVLFAFLETFFPVKQSNTITCVVNYAVAM